MSESSFPILIVGAGVAGTVLAISLRRKGYKVTLFEKYNGPAPGGASLNLAPNGLQVLDSIGLAKPLFSRGIAAPVERVSYRTNEGSLVESDIPLRVAEKAGFPFAGVKRSVFLQYLLDCVKDEGIDIHLEHAMRSIQQNEDSVLVTFENGKQVMGSILIGCDGLHSQTRISVFGRENPQYTELTQTAGMTFVPHRHRKMQNIYGDSLHVISYAVGNTSSPNDNRGSFISWAVTREEKEGRESWKSENSDSFRKELLDQLNFEWDNGILAKELVESSPTIIKFGLYDRKELSTWYENRVVLIGDAAHPTAPHLGQGANQALEDVKTLVASLAHHVPPSMISAAKTNDFKTAFESLNEKRIQRTSSLVAKAREVGWERILPAYSVEARERNRRIREQWTQDAVAIQMYEELLGLELK